MAKRVQALKRKSIEVVSSPSKSVIAAQGVLIGVMHNSVSLHFFVEYPTLPRLQDVPVDSSGRINMAKITNQESEIILTREVTGSIVVSRETALSLLDSLTKILKDSASE